MISYKASVAQICVLFRFNDRQWSLTNPCSPNKCFYLVSMIVNDLLQSLGRPNMCLTWLYMIVNMFFFICCLWSSMIFYKASVAQICVLYGHIWSWMIFNEASVAQICVLYGYIWSWMIFNEASVAQKCFLFDLYDRQWSLTQPRLPKYVSYLDSMIINDLLQILSRPTNVFIWSLW